MLLSAGPRGPGRTLIELILCRPLPAPSLLSGPEGPCLEARPPSTDPPVLPARLTARAAARGMVLLLTWGQRSPTLSVSAPSRAVTALPRCLEREPEPACHVPVPSNSLSSSPGPFWS